VSTNDTHLPDGTDVAPQEGFDDLLDILALVEDVADVVEDVRIIRKTETFLLRWFHQWDHVTKDLRHAWIVSTHLLVQRAERRTSNLFPGNCLWNTD
jgi:hypothetical protein